MSGPVSPWTKQPPAEGTAEARAAKLLAELEAPRTLTDDERARIVRAFANPAAAGAPRHRARWFGGMMVLTAAIAGAWWAGTRDSAPATPIVPEPVRAAAVAEEVRAESVVVEAAPPAEREIIAAPPPMRAKPPRKKAAPPTRVAIASPIPAPPPPPVAAPEEPAPAPQMSLLEREARSLANVVRLLRDEGAPAAALAALEGHRAEFPQGFLKPEADLVELDAQLAAGERTEALALLERLDPLNDPTLPRRSEWLVLEAELLAETARCDRAEPRFDAALTSTAPGVLERALWGKAHCLGRRGELGEARRTLEDYLQRFPHGRYAEQARRELGR